MFPKSLPAAPSLEHLKKQAKDLLAALHAHDPAARARIHAQWPERPHPMSSLVPALSLSEAQWVIAREYGFASWPRLKRHVEKVAATHQIEASNDSAAWATLLRAHPDMAHLPDEERQTIPPIRTAQWRVTTTRWSDPTEEEHDLPMQEWIRLHPPAHAWRANYDNSWAHDVIDARGHLHTGSSWKVSNLRPQARALTAEDLLGKVLFWSPEREANYGSNSPQRLHSVWRQETVEVEGQALVRWHQETIEANFRVTSSIWTEAATHRIVRQERRETNLLTGKPACFEVFDQYLYNTEPPAGTFEMPAGKPIVTPDFKDIMPEAWDILSAKQQQAIRETIDRSDAGWHKADFAAFASVWEFGLVSQLPTEAEWKERVHQQEGVWSGWNSEIASANTLAYIPMAIATHTYAMMKVKDKILRVKVKLRVTWGAEANPWEGTSEFFLRRKGRRYQIVHWECPWEEIKAAWAETLK